MLHNPQQRQLKVDGPAFGGAAFEGYLNDRPIHQPPVLRQYWRVVVRRRWIIGGIVLATIVLGLVITMLTTPKYTATSTIEISRQQDKIVNVQEVRPESSSVDMEFYQTQYSLLRSRTLAGRVVDDLKLADDPRFLDMFGVDRGGGLFSENLQRRPAGAERAKLTREATDLLLSTVALIRSRAHASWTSISRALILHYRNAWSTHGPSASLS
jgi:polysaccharide biosynthesis transport protein